VPTVSVAAPVAPMFHLHGSDQRHDNQSTDDCEAALSAHAEEEDSAVALFLRVVPFVAVSSRSSSAEQRRRPGPRTTRWSPTVHRILRDWLSEHAKDIAADGNERARLASCTGLTDIQVRHWVNRCRFEQKRGF
jgi:hypothetical protein